MCPPQADHNRAAQAARRLSRKQRLDQELVDQGFFSTVDGAARAVMAGEVSGRSSRFTSAGTPVERGAYLHVKARRPYVSRGGDKLAGALKAFALDPTGLNCLDIGCSTGGFTDCLLGRGAARVASVDVGQAQFDWSLRTNPRVALFEQCNICSADPRLLGAPFDLLVCDVSFTSVGHILDAICACIEPSHGVLCTLVKPQFEARRAEVDEGGIVRDPAVHLRVLRDLVDCLQKDGRLQPRALCVSPIKGAKGNIEYFLYAGTGHPGDDAWQHILADGAVFAPEDAGACVQHAWELPAGGALRADNAGSIARAASVSSTSSTEPSIAEGAAGAHSAAGAGASKTREQEA